MAGREGLVDTAVKTAETGYMSRRLMKVGWGGTHANVAFWCWLPVVWWWRRGSLHTFTW